VRLSIAERAYAAGIIDGEGCIGCYQGRWRVTVSQNEPEIPEWLHERFGGTIRHAVFNQSYREEPFERWTWGVYSKADVKAALSAVVRYLIRKREKAEAACA
jgi:hypothetical protein